METLSALAGFLAIFGLILAVSFGPKALPFFVGLLLTNTLGIVFGTIAFKLGLSAQVTFLILSGVLLGNLLLLFKYEVNIFWTVPINWVQFSQTSSKIDVLGSGQIMTLPQATLLKEDMRSLGVRPFRMSFEVERAETIFIAIISGSYRPGSDSDRDQEPALKKYFELGTEAAAYAAIGVDLAGSLKPWIQFMIEGVLNDSDVRGQVRAINTSLTAEVELIDAIEASNGIDLKVKLEDLALPLEFQETRDLRNRLQTIIDLSFLPGQLYAVRERAALAENPPRPMPPYDADKMQKLIETLMAGDPQSNVFAARGNRGGQGVAPFALLNLAPRDNGGTATPVVITNPEIKLPEKGATPAKAVVFTIAVLIALAAIVWNIMVFEKTWSSGKEVVFGAVKTISGGGETSERQSEAPVVFKKVSIMLTQNWSPKIYVISDEQIIIWKSSGLEARTNNQDLVIFDKGETTSAMKWVQYRTSAVEGRMKYCIYPKNADKDVCKD